MITLVIAGTIRYHQSPFWTAPAKRSDDGAFPQRSNRRKHWGPVDSRISVKLSKKSGVALRFPPHSKNPGPIASDKTSSDW